MRDRPEEPGPGARVKWLWINPEYAGLIAAMRHAEAASKGRPAASPWRTRSFLFPPTR